MEYRLTELERLVGQQRELIAELRTNVQHLLQTQDELLDELRPLREALAKGKGAGAVLLLLASMVGGAVAAVVEALFRQ